jgi:hypothetical protein
MSTHDVIDSISHDERGIFNFFNFKTTRNNFFSLLLEYYHYTNHIYESQCNERNYDFILCVKKDIFEYKMIRR